MFFVIASLIIAVACSSITVKTLIGYNDLGILSKILITFSVVLGWVSPLLISLIRKNDYLSGDIFDIISHTGYYLFGLAFILFIMLFLRDFVWYMIYGLAKLFDSASWWINPKNITVLKYANFVVVFLAIIISFYAVYEGTKIPTVKNVEFSSTKLNKDLSIVQLSDIHINRSSSAERLQKVVDKTNELNPDIIVLTGDVIDDDISYLNSHIDILGGLKADKGIYFSVGNHENYNGLYNIIKKLSSIGVKVLFNRGEPIAEQNVFISGIPDMQTAMSSEFYAVNFEKAVRGSDAKNYRILLSHSPEMANFVTEVAFDLVLAGHTHGGQIFPFHILVQKANKYLAGSYKVNNVDLYVSRGTGYWGPAMRLLAPSEITNIKVKAVKKTNPSKKINDANIKEMINAQNFGLGL